MIHWAALGMFFKAASWSVAFILLAKGASKLFFWNELVANVYVLGLNLLGYYLKGLDGLGISFMISYVLYLLQVCFLAHNKYGFKFMFEFYKIFGIQFFLGLICFLSIKFVPIPWAYFIGIPVILLSSWYSFHELDKRIGFREIVFRFLRK